MIDAYNSLTAQTLAAHANLLIAVGTSLSVYPFADLANPYKEQKLIIINQTSTSKDNKADLVFHEDATVIFEEINKLLGE